MLLHPDTCWSNTPTVVCSDVWSLCSECEALSMFVLVYCESRQDVSALMPRVSLVYFLMSTMIIPSEQGKVLNDNCVYEVSLLWSAICILRHVIDMWDCSPHHVWSMKGAGGSVQQWCGHSAPTFVWKTELIWEGKWVSLVGWLGSHLVTGRSSDLQRELGVGPLLLCVEMPPGHLPLKRLDISSGLVTPPAPPARDYITGEKDRAAES